MLLHEQENSNTNCHNRHHNKDGERKI